MELNVNDYKLSEYEETEIKKLLQNQNSLIHDDLEQIWNLMDRVWDELGCNNTKLNWDNIQRFYEHPIWLLNGLFIEQHNLSIKHRSVISNWVVTHHGISQVLDYGGGFGTIARLIVSKKSPLSVDIYEPHPIECIKEKILDYKNIKFINSLNSKYDVIISTDVLEHVPEPLKVLSDMIQHLEDDGYLIIANCFYPVIKCHLPCTFHLRYTFNMFARYMGLEMIGLIEGSHATLFKKKKRVSVNWTLVKFMEINSKIVFPFLEFSKPILKPVYRLLFKH